MKICLINNLFQLYEGHQRLYVDMIAEELAKEHKVIVITTSSFSGLKSLKPRIEKRNGIKIYRFFPLILYNHYPYKQRPLPVRIMWHLIDIWNLHPYLIIRNILERERPDIVHSMNLIGMSTSVFSAVRASGCCHVHTTTDGAILSPWANLLRNGKKISFNWLDRLYIKIKKSIVKSPNAVAALSNFMLNTHLKHGYFKNSKKYVIDYPSRFHQQSGKAKSYSPFNILFVGNIISDKGVYVLLEAFEQMGRNNCHLHFVGNGPDLVNLKLKAGSNPSIHIYGNVSDDELIELYSQANVTVVPSLCYEAGKAAAFLESIPFGTPVIISTAGGGHEGVIDGVNGRLFEPNDSLTLKNILLDLIDNREKLRNIEEGAFKSADDYRLDKCIRSFIEIYNEVRYGSPN